MPTFISKMVKLEKGVSWVIKFRIHLITVFANKIKKS